jgi:hypothetical protein
MQAGTVASQNSEGPDRNIRRLEEMERRTDGMERRPDGWNSGQMGVQTVDREPEIF